MSESIVNTKVQDALVDVINKSVSAFEQGATFLSAELPDVVHQLLLWKAVESSMVFLLGILFLITPLFVYLRFGGKGKELTPASQNSYASHVPTLTHDKYGKPDDGMIPFSLLTTVCLIFAVFAINVTWLQILIAPKIFLIEYAANLLK